MTNDESNSNDGMTNDQKQWLDLLSRWRWREGKVGVRAQAVVASGGINGGAVVGNSLTVGTLNSLARPCRCRGRFPAGWAVCDGECGCAIFGVGPN